ncbi:S1 RNA-binding domain-containing protein 1 [Cylas formicarius]|uniref:S1 RNA-binding domain-containing protein 1 n=1 Tax=Cylas formicarius TaxID=197179 RepID=UPI002958843A|nr:S1 RNA-binding domain-containing protein 1 [Cylas formicarius]
MDMNTNVLKNSGKILKRKAKRSKWLGEISLVSSDEDTSRDHLTKQGKNRGCENLVEIITSDEEDNIKNAKLGTKRALGHADPPSTPPKKSKITESGKNITKQQKCLSRKRVETSKPLTAKTSKRVVDENVDESKKINPVWEDYEILTDRNDISPQTAKNLIKLFDEGVSIPFIARYRKSVTQNMSPDALREVKKSYDDISNLRDKISAAAKTIQRAGKFTDQIRQQISRVKNFEELEFICAPFKSECRDTKANKARKLGLEGLAHQLLNNSNAVDITSYVNCAIDGLKSVEEIEMGVVDIISTDIVLDPDVLKFIREMRSKQIFYLKVSERQKRETKNEKSQKVAAGKGEKKYDLYIGKEFRMDLLKPHQILAINRGELQKCLSVKVKFPEFFAKQFKNLCLKKWFHSSSSDYLRQNIINKAIDQAYNKFFKPHVTRHIRSELTRQAHRASYDVFSVNLKQLLLTPPLKGKIILGVDPGFRNGCKLALISATGTLLEYNVIYVHRNKSEAETILKQMLLKYECELIALGNGHGCRDAEIFISDLIKTHSFGNLNVRYTIICEDGASIYSCSTEAAKEFPNMDPNIISAISLARRVQDPMAELVKVDPAHLGIGMYQHDLKKKELATALGEVVSECVSFVGVDLNTTSVSLLRHVAGLTEKKAKLIIRHREQNGAFTSRSELRDVSTIGEKTFQQCAGFLYVGPTDGEDKHFYKSKETTPLDRTIIHPESYEVAKRIISRIGLQESDIGSESFIKTIKQKYSCVDANTLSQELGTSKDIVQLILDSLSQRLNYDLRQKIGTTPLFKQEVTCFESLSLGLVLTGRITNVTHFGAFVDVGVGSNGLIHVTKMNGLVLNIGDKVETKVLDVDRNKKHIALEALAIV